MNSFWDTFGDDNDEAGDEHRDLELWHDDAASVASEGVASAPAERSADDASEQDPDQAQRETAPSPRLTPDAVDAVLADDETATAAAASTSELTSARASGMRRKAIFAVVLVLLLIIGFAAAFGGGKKTASQQNSSSTDTGAVNRPSTTYGVTILPTTAPSSTGTATVGPYVSEAKVVVGQAARFLRSFDRLHGGLPGSDAKLTKLLADAVGVPVATSGSKPGVLVYTRLQIRNSVLLTMTDAQTKSPAVLMVQLPR